MFEIGFWEILLILILALLVIGPERLPAAARTVGFWFGKARRYVEGVRDEVSQEFDFSELKRLIHNQEAQINELQQKLHTPLKLDDDEDIANNTSAAYEIIEQDVTPTPTPTTADDRDEDTATATDDEATRK